MMYRTNPSQRLQTRRIMWMAALMGALSSPVAWAQSAPRPATDASASLVRARVDGVLSSAEAVRALPGNVLCRNEALKAGGTWLVVSRSWGGSPNLRHRQLVAWAPDQPPPVGRVEVAWRSCGKPA